MSQCPLCAAEIKEDFGLIECPNCSAQLIVHMDGRVEYSGGQDSADSTTFEEAGVSEQEQKEEEEFLFAEAPQEFDLQAPELESESEPESEEAGAHPPTDFGAHQSDEGLFGNDDHTVALPQDATFALPAPDESAVDLFGERDPTVIRPVAKSTPVPTPSPVPRPSRPAVNPPPKPIEIPEGSADLSDIARFGNSDASSLRDGSLRYNLLISGIDTADVRDAFREAITDRKLVWDTEAILRTLRNGEVRIENVTPPKAYIIISRLRNLPVHVFWEQYAIAQS